MKAAIVYKSDLSFVEHMYSLYGGNIRKKGKQWKVNMEIEVHWRCDLLKAP